MMSHAESAQVDPVSAAEPQSKPLGMLRRWFGQSNGASGASETPKEEDQGPPDQSEGEPRPGLIRRVSRKVVPGLPRAQTFKRQQAEVRNNLEPVQPTPAERRAVSVDRRLHASQNSAHLPPDPRTSAPEFRRIDAHSSAASVPSIPGSPAEENMLDSIGGIFRPEGVSQDARHMPDSESYNDTASVTTSQYYAVIHEELERIWILNLSMHFRDKSKREKFFVTYREKNVHWRRVTISLDYRGAPDNSLEMDLFHTKFQRDKSAKIYEAIRESLADIQFYETVTNLKLQTTDGRLHVHVVEDVNEIIHYPTVRMIQHLRCSRVREQEIGFESHMSGFVYKVRVNGQTLIKKEIPGPDTVDEFLYEINALSRLSNSGNVIQFYGVVVDDYGEHVKGLLISYADRGALVDVIFDHDHTLPWTCRERWARQIVEGLSEIHEAGFVQGDFTLSNIVIDEDNDAKIIDINRRGCPVGWEPPEATPLIESNQRLSMYIGVKSDLYQLGMVLWALAEQEDEPETHGRPLTLSEELEIPEWYRGVVSKCLAADPRDRMQAIDLLQMFPHREAAEADIPQGDRPSISVDDGYAVREYFVDEFQDNGRPIIRTIQSPPDWPRGDFGPTYVDSPTGLSNEPYYFQTRGRSPPSPLPSNLDYCEPHYTHQSPAQVEERDYRLERMRSPSKQDLVPAEMVQASRVEDSTPQAQQNARQVREEAEEPPRIKVAVAEHDSATPTQGNEFTKNQGKSTPSEEACEVVEIPLERPTGGDGKEQQPSVNPEHRDIIIQENVGVEVEAPGVTRNEANEFNGNNNNKNPLFREAGITEPEAPETIALVSRAAEIQNSNKSAGKVMDSKQAKKEEKVNSAIETKPPISLPEHQPMPQEATASLSWHISPASSGNTKVPEELRFMGYGYDQSDVAAIRWSSDDIDGDLANM